MLLALLLMWGAWAFAGRVSIVSISRRARFESRLAIRRIAAPASGRITSVNIALGQKVRRGQVLIELDDAEPAIRRDSARANIDATRRRMTTAIEQIAAIRTSGEARKRAGASRIQAARANGIQAGHLAAIEEARAARLARMAGDGLIPTTDADDARRRADAERARVRSLLAAEEQAVRERAENTAALDAVLHELESDRLELETRLITEEAALHEAELQIERLRVRAPTEGRVDSFAELRAGVWIAEGTAIASIMPADLGEVTAYFGLADMPLLRGGQPATIWLEAVDGGGRRRFPARVIAVERNASGEEFRVTLRLAAGAIDRVEQGFPAVATVEVLRLSPFQALLRAAGMLPPRTTPA